LESASLSFEGTNTLIVLDDYAASKDVKGRRGELVKLGFSARHSGICVGADPAALKHRETFSRERGCDRAVLHAIGQNYEGNLRRIRERAFS